MLALRALPSGRRAPGLRQVTHVSRGAKSLRTNSSKVGRKWRLACGNAGAAFGIQWVEQKMPPTPAARPPESDSALVQSIANDHAAFERLTRRHNSRLFRARWIPRRLPAHHRLSRRRASHHLARRTGRSPQLVARWSTVAPRGFGETSRRSAPGLTARGGGWLTRIVINQSLMRLRAISGTGGGALPGGNPA